MEIANTSDPSSPAAPERDQIAEFMAVEPSQLQDAELALGQDAAGEDDDDDELDSEYIDELDSSSDELDSDI
jgi:hypothetical protein